MWYRLKALVCRVRGHWWAETPVPELVAFVVAVKYQGAVIAGHVECGRCGVSRLKLEITEVAEHTTEGEPDEG